MPVTESARFAVASGGQSSAGSTGSMRPTVIHGLGPGSCRGQRPRVASRGRRFCGTGTSAESRLRSPWRPGCDVPVVGDLPWRCPVLLRWRTTLFAIATATRSGAVAGLWEAICARNHADRVLPAPVFPPAMRSGHKSLYLREQEMRGAAGGGGPRRGMSHASIMSARLWSECRGAGLACAKVGDGFQRRLAATRGLPGTTKKPFRKRIFSSSGEMDRPVRPQLWRWNLRQQRASDLPRTGRFRAPACCSSVHRFRIAGRGC